VESVFALTLAPETGRFPAGVSANADQGRRRRGGGVSLAAVG
jgi:hypothetical protein